MPRMPPIDVSTTASARNWKRISCRRAPSALRTPISRVRSVTEIIMIAITPMPPTISAIDEMTTSARNVALADLIPQPAAGVLRDEVEVVRLVELEAVADAHDLLDLAQRLLARAPSSRHDARSCALWRRPSRRPRGVGAEHDLVRGLRDDDEVVLADVEAADRRPLAEDADDRVFDRRRCGPSCRSDRGRFGRTAPGTALSPSTTTRRRCDTSGSVKKRPSSQLHEVDRRRSSRWRRATVSCLVRSPP